LTSDGNKVVEHINQESEVEINKISALVSTCQKTVNLDANMLSCAAKVYYIISSQSKRMTVNEIQKTAGSFGWNLSQNQINGAVDLLKQLYSVK
jgi:N-acetylmuramic acid 6-phosphate (MurNAc-6-P) etherase